MRAESGPFRWAWSPVSWCRRVDAVVRGAQGCHLLRFSMGPTSTVLPGLRTLFPFDVHSSDRIATCILAKCQVRPFGPAEVHQVPQSGDQGNFAFSAGRTNLRVWQCASKMAERDVGTVVGIHWLSPRQEQSLHLPTHDAGHQRVRARRRQRHGGASEIVEFFLRVSGAHHGRAPRKRSTPQPPFPCAPRHSLGFSSPHARGHPREHCAD